MSTVPQSSPPQVGGGESVVNQDHSRRAVRSGFFGSALEFYDFFIYTQAAALVFPQIFFPKGNPTVAIIASLGTYGVGYIARPIGAFVLGWMSDKIGRRRQLILTISLMGLGTLAIGLLPTYAMIGLWAPALLVVARLIQGFAVAGEISGSSTLILEHTPVGRRGERGSKTLQGTAAGQIVSALIFIPLAHFLSTDDFNAWGWRIPFILSAVLFAYAIKVRLRTVESKKAEGPEQSPILDVFRKTPKALLCVFLIALCNVIPTTINVFGTAYATQAAYGVGWRADVYLWIPVVANVVGVFTIPWVGKLSDKIGRRPCMIVGPIAAGLLAIPYLWAVSTQNVVLALILNCLCWGLVYQGFNAVFPAFFPEQFPAHTRVTGMAIGQNLGTAVSALLAMLFAWVAPPGSTPLQVMGLVGGITLGVTIVVAIAAYVLPETSRIRREDLGKPGALPVPEVEYQAIRAAAVL